MTERLVREYYSGQGIKEWKRLVRDSYHKLEFDTTTHFIQKHLHKKKGLILDAGGGPGRYAIWFGKLGYDVVLLDLSLEMLEIAKSRIRRSGIQKRVKQIIQGLVDDLSVFESETFDAVVCLGGPLSHIVDDAKREKAIDELIRVTKKGSHIFVSVIGRPAVLVNELIRLPKEIELDFFPVMRDTGNYYGGFGFAPCHFFLPEELEESLEKGGVRVLEMVGLEGLASGHRKETNMLARKQPTAWKIWWETHLKTCTHPTSVGISEHFMAICKKH
ncbi:class I SAM-dependent methyltransferase [Candidatus Bathyarchaeota archaeon]|nr:class I SAM-dependent methyltransferase [Candidatus Bathyarchaeota archaeon]